MCQQIIDCSDIVELSVGYLLANLLYALFHNLDTSHVNTYIVRSKPRWNIYLELDILLVQLCLAPVVFVET